MKREVVVTGINIISALGLDMSTSWKNLLQGKSGVGRISRFDASDLETRFAAEVSSDFDIYSEKFIKKRISKQMTRSTRMGFVCAKEAMQTYNIDPGYYLSDRCGVICGVVSTGNSSVEKGTTYKNSILRNMVNSLPAWLSLEYGFEGPGFTVSTACSSSAYALGQAHHLISTGQSDLIIVSSSDSTINPEEIKGFNEIMALSTNNSTPSKASRPFAKSRDGFVIGEGAGAIVLEEKQNAIKRGANILADFKGYALTNEAYNIVSPHPEGMGMLRTMSKALAAAGIAPGEVDHINAHGTSTTLNDLYETQAIKNLLGDHAYDITVVSSKSMLGHTIGAAGVIEAAITIMAIREQQVHPTINLDDPDPELDLDYVSTKAKQATIANALSNSFAFGGHNATLVFGRH